MNDPWFTEAHSGRKNVRRFKLKCTSAGRSYDYNLWYYIPGCAVSLDATACWAASLTEQRSAQEDGERVAGPSTFTGMCSSPEEALRQLTSLVAASVREKHMDAQLLIAEAHALDVSLQHTVAVMQRGVVADELLNDRHANLPTTEGTCLVEDT